MIIQYNQLLPVSDIVARFYQVDESAVIWLSTIVHVFQFILELPTAFLSTRITLRNFIIIGCSLNFIGSGKISNIALSHERPVSFNFIIFFSALRNCGFRPELFWLVYLGQIFSQLSWSFMISKAAVLANKWFKTDEISIATAIGSTGDLFGLAIGFLVPPFIVKTSSGTDKMFKKLI